MNIKKIENLIENFSNERDWKQFHTPKNLCMALSVEVSELVEIFQWLKEDESFNLDIPTKEHAKEEVADIAIYLINICMKLDIDLESAILDKMKKNALKYPIEKSK